MSSTAEEAVQEQDAAVERFIPVAVAAIEAAVAIEAAKAEGVAEVDTAPLDALESSIKLIVLAAVVSMITSAYRRHKLDRMPDDAEVERTVDVVTPHVRDEAWQWAVDYARDQAGAKQAISIDSSAKRMARTLATRTAAEASLATAHLLRMPYKVWISRGDGSVRSTHRTLHGHPVPMDSPFRRWPSGQVLDFPGDPRAPLREIVNCRCMVIFAPTAEGVAEALAPADLDKAFALAASLDAQWGFDD